jgi:hypothetical protein
MQPVFAEHTSEMVWTMLSPPIATIIFSMPMRTFRAEANVAENTIQLRIRRQ